VWESYCSLSICQNLFCFAYDKTFINQRRVEKSAFEDQSQENSVWIIKWTTLLGMFCKITFTPAVTSCYQVHALNVDAHLSAALLCYFWCNWCRNLAAVNCTLHWIVPTLSTLHTRNSSCITLLWLHHNHKMCISYHKNGLDSSHQIVGRWFIFMCFVIRIIDETSWLSTASLSLCQDGIRGSNHFAFMWIVFIF